MSNFIGRKGFGWYGLFVGVGLTPVLSLFAIASGGAGHGHYVLARVIFPYTMLLIRLANDEITPPLLALALVLLLLFGLAVGLALFKRRIILAVIILLF